MYEPVSFSLPLEIARGLDLDMEEESADGLHGHMDGNDNLNHPEADEYLQPELRHREFLGSEALLGRVSSLDETF